MTRMLDAAGAAALLDGADSILVLTHKNPDGDTIGSAAGICCALRARGRSAFLYRNPGFTARYAPYVSELLAPESGWQPDFILAVDTASAAMLAKGAEHYADKVDLLIDHHAFGTPYARHSYVRPEVAATGELAVDIIRRLGVPLSHGLIADALYIAVASDTGCFRHANTTPDTLRHAATLMEAGARTVKINREFFVVKSPARLALEAMLYNGIEYFEGGAVAVVTLSAGARERSGVREEDIEDISNLAFQIDGVEAGITLRELEGGRWKASLRTSARFNAAAACATLGGGGHVRAAGVTVDGPREAVLTRVLAALLSERQGG